MTFPCFEIIKSEKNNLFYWNLYPRNGKKHGPILKSVRGFKSKQNAQKNIAAIKNKVEKTNSKKRKDKKYTVESFVTLETANQENIGLYFWINGTKTNPKTGLKNKLAISKVYTSNLDSVQSYNIADLGRKKGILCILRIAEKSPVYDLT